MSQYILEEYLDFRAHSESPANFHRWAFIACCAAALGRNVFMRHGTKRIYPNMYVLLIGASGSRKSEAIKPARKLLQRSGFRWFAFEKSSKQKFVQDMQDSVEKDFKTAMAFDMDGPTEAFIANDEFLDFIGVGNTEFVTLLTTFWDNIDKYEDRFKRSESVTVSKPTVNILGGMTPTNLQLGLNPNAEGIGFLSRSLLVYGEPTGEKIAWPEIPNEAAEQQFVEFFKHIRNHKGMVHFDAAARDAITDIYKSWAPLVDARFNSYSTRRQEHLFRLLMVIVSMRLDLRVTVDDIEYANTILSFTEQRMSKALGEFGKSIFSSANQRIISYMEEVNRPCSMEELYKIVQTELNKWAEMVNVLNGLMKADKIQASANGDKFILKQRILASRGVYVDYQKYIREAAVYERLDQERAEQTKLFEKAAAAAAPSGQPCERDVGGQFEEL